MRQNSPILFTAVLAAASKFFRRDVYPYLLAHAQTLFTRALNSGLCDTGIIQSLMILVYWKAPTDGTAWLKLGIAVRMGYQLRWHEVTRRDLPAGEFEARAILVRYKTNDD